MVVTKHTFKGMNMCISKKCVIALLIFNGIAQGYGDSEGTVGMAVAEKKATLKKANQDLTLTIIDAQTDRGPTIAQRAMQAFNGGANPDLTATNGKLVAPLFHFAIRSCNQSLIALFLDHGVDATICSRDGTNVVELALQTGNLVLVKFFCSWAAWNMGKFDKNRKGPL
jgi:hypothetical protein